MVRLPIGDWTFTPYSAYVGCMDGAKEKIEWFLDLCSKYDLKVLIDIHAMKGSQNGFDNSGISHKLKWIDDNNFMHWEILAAEWMGPWNGKSYDFIDFQNIQWAVNVVDDVLTRWGSHNAVYAIEPVNEPWANSNMNVLKDFYRTVRSLIKSKAPHLVFVFHDAFQFSSNVWNDLFDDDDIDNVVMDTHFYTAWWGSNKDIGAYCDGYGQGLSEAKNIKYDVWVGEWSLATDVCAMWLGGFNDNNSPYVFECNWISCPYSYLKENAVDFDRTAPTLGPNGTNPQTVQYGNCSSDSLYFNDDDIRTLGQCAIYVFNDLVEGHFLWTFKNELEPRWSYTESFERGWIA
jgi:glucan 1,3-beta-glucosidase